MEPDTIDMMGDNELRSELRKQLIIHEEQSAKLKQYSKRVIDLHKENKRLVDLLGTVGLQP